nr:DUF4946 domain-containing protein [Pseudomonas aeruginosa]
MKFVRSSPSRLACSGLRLGARRLSGKLGTLSPWARRLRGRRHGDRSDLSLRWVLRVRKCYEKQGVRLGAGGSGGACGGLRQQWLSARGRLAGRLAGDHREHPTRGQRRGATGLSRQLATKLGPGGEKEASIELLSLKMMEEESVEIDGQFQSVFDVVQSGYRKAGLGSRCTTPIRSNLGGLASLETHCRISQGNEVLLTQIVAMALGQRAMYSLVYTASPANSVVYRQSYLRTRASLVLR